MQRIKNMYYHFFSREKYAQRHLTGESKIGDNCQI